MLRADPYSLRSLGGVFLQASSFLRDRANRVQRGAEELLQGPTGWRGDAPQAFLSSCHLWHDDLIKICNTFERAASTLTQLAYRVEHIEQLRQEARQYENACWDLDPQNPQEQHQLQYLRSRARDLYAAAEMESMAADQQAATSFREMETVEKSLNLLYSPVWQQYEHNLLLAKLRGLSKAERMGYYDSKLDEEVFQQDFGLMGNEELRAQIRAREEKQQQSARDETALVNQVTSMGLDFVPVVGNVKSAVEAVSGKDYITGEQLTKGQRVLAAVGILFGGLKTLGKVGRAADKGLAFARFEPLPKVEARIVDLKKGSHVVTERTGNLVDELVKKSKCSNAELVQYIKSNDGYLKTNYAEEFTSSGKWPDQIQIPKDASVLNADGSIKWSEVPNGGYVLNKNGDAIKEVFIPKVGDVLDRYGPPNGRYTSPVIDGKPYSYDQRSLPYIEDVSKYHQYEVVGDFSKLEEYVSKCQNSELKMKIEAMIDRYYNGDYSKVIAQRGEIARGFGSSGGGIQYELPLPVEWLEGLGLLKELTKLP